ncbi:MAG: tyrosine-type recombinase/integrase [Parasporobacterium sp.]|nr:tyrosine-type recombinase/integrase [Parasporobacterium sp.]
MSQFFEYSYRGYSLSSNDEFEWQKEQNRILSCKETWIFPNTRGTMTNYNNVDVCIANIVKNINADGIDFKPFSVHAFRDTFATRCIEQGMQPQTLKTILGHSSLKMTMDLYAHVMPNTKAEELSKTNIAM